MDDVPRFPLSTPGKDEKFFGEEVALALRNRGVPLEALAHDVTPSSMHYLLVHFDVPHVDGAGWRLGIDGLVEYEMSLSSTICGTARR